MCSQPTHHSQRDWKSVQCLLGGFFMQDSLCILALLSSLSTTFLRGIRGTYRGQQTEGQIQRSTV